VRCLRHQVNIAHLDFEGHIPATDFSDSGMFEGPTVRRQREDGAGEEGANVPPERPHHDIN
jgi:hypothetical protein